MTISEIVDRMVEIKQKKKALTAENDKLQAQLQVIAECDLTDTKIKSVGYPGTNGNSATVTTSDTVSVIAGELLQKIFGITIMLLSSALMLTATPFTIVTSTATMIGCLNQWETINSGMTISDKQKLSALKNYDDTALKSEIEKAAEEAALNCSTLGYRRKNLLKNTAVSKTQNGVTFTVNEDSTVTVSGTATAGVTLPIGNAEVEKGRIYAVSGCPLGGSSLSYHLDARYYKNNTLTVIRSMIDIGEGTAVTLPEDADDNRLFIYIRTGEGTKIDSLVFRPMLRYADIADDSYEPYNSSVEERLVALESRLAEFDGVGT